MEKAIEKAGILVEALSYILGFNEKRLVIKLGGAAMEGSVELTDTMTDVVFLAAVGMKPILVHGGGPAVSQAMKKLGREPKFVNGRRVTDLETLQVVKQVLVERINGDIVREIDRMGGMAEQIYPDHNDLIAARRIQMKDESGKAYDLGFVGEVESINVSVLDRLLTHDIIPVVAPLGADASGQHYNINADTVASEIAAALHCEKLVYMSDTHGIYTNAKDPTTMASHLSEDEINTLVGNGTITSGMLPKVEGCLRAVKAGVRKAHIIDGRIPHALLLEIFTAKGIGTEIVLS